MRNIKFFVAFVLSLGLFSCDQPSKTVSCFPYDLQEKSMSKSLQQIIGLKQEVNQWSAKSFSEAYYHRHVIDLFDISEQLVRRLRSHPDVIRATCVSQASNDELAEWIYMHEMEQLSRLLQKVEQAKPITGDVMLEETKLRELALELRTVQKKLVNLFKTIDEEK